MTVTDLFESRPDENTATVLAVADGKSQPAHVVLNEEHSLSLFLGNSLLHRFTCSPHQLGALCAGWLFTQGYDVDAVEVSRDGATATARGACTGAAPVQPVDKIGSLPATPEEMLALFLEASDPYRRSHGMHSCILKGAHWQIIGRDIGRHNAIDKAIGAAILAGYPLQGAVLFTSGRINVQTVEKAARCGIGCLMSKATVTAQALTLAKALDLRVFFRVKEGGYITV